MDDATKIFYQRLSICFGLIGFWIPYPAWLIWMFIASYFLLGDLKRRAGEVEQPVVAAQAVR